MMKNAIIREARLFLYALPLFLVAITLGTLFEAERTVWTYVFGAVLITLLLSSADFYAKRNDGVPEELKEVVWNVEIELDHWTTWAVSAAIVAALIIFI